MGGGRSDSRTADQLRPWVALGFAGAESFGSAGPCNGVLCCIYVFCVVPLLKTSSYTNPKYFVPENVLLIAVVSAVVLSICAYFSMLVWSTICKLFLFLAAFCVACEVAWPPLCRLVPGIILYVVRTYSMIILGYTQSA